MPRISRDSNKIKHNSGKSVTRTLHLMHHSMKFDEDPSLFYADLDTDLARTPDVMTLSEMNRFRPQINQLAQKYGYVVGMNQNVEEAILVRKDPNISLKKYDYQKVLNQFGKTLVAPWYSARYISWVRIDYYGQSIWVHTQHWIAHVYELARFPNDHAKQTKAMGALMKQHGEGPANAFFMGDLNWQPGALYTGRFSETTRPDKILQSYGCDDAYDELAVGYPGTFQDGRTLDWCYRYMRDTNVTAKRYKVYPAENSDHRCISFWYDLDFSVAQPGTTPTPTPGDNGSVDPDFYATGGDVNWDDFRDATVYPVDRVTDDSDYLRS